MPSVRDAFVTAVVGSMVDLIVCATRPVGAGLASLEGLMYLKLIFLDLRLFHSFLDLLVGFRRRRFFLFFLLFFFLWLHGAEVCRHAGTRVRGYAGTQAHRILA